jgi:hypothetical protein
MKGDGAGQPTAEPVRTCSPSMTPKLTANGFRFGALVS